MRRRIVLVVEHERGASRAVWAPLTAAGFEVVVAACADEGRAWFDHRSPAAVVIDAAIPIQESRSLFRHARRWAREHDPDLPVLLVRLQSASPARYGRGAPLRRRALADLLEAALQEPRELLRRAASR